MRESGDGTHLLSRQPALPFRVSILKAGHQLAVGRNFDIQVPLQLPSLQSSAAAARRRECRCGRRCPAGAGSALSPPVSSLPTPSAMPHATPRCACRWWRACTRRQHASQCGS